MHDIAGVGAHHDELAMRHVDHAHYAESDSQTDGGQKIDRGERQGVQRQIGGLVQPDIEQDRFKRLLCGIGNGGVRFGVKQHEVMRGQCRRLILQRHQGWHRPGRRQSLISRLARGICGQRGNGDASDLPVRDGGDQRVPDRGDARQWRGKIRLDQPRIGFCLG